MEAKRGQSEPRLHRAALTEGASPFQTPQIAGSIAAAGADLSDTLHGGRLHLPPSGCACVGAVVSESSVGRRGRLTALNLTDYDERSLVSQCCRVFRIFPTTYISSFTSTFKHLNFSRL